MLKFNEWIKIKEGPLDDPEHALFGDFDHLSNRNKPKRAKIAAPNGEYVDPHATTFVGGQTTSDQQTKNCMQKIDALEKRLSNLELSLNGNAPKPTNRMQYAQNGNGR